MRRSKRGCLGLLLEGLQIQMKLLIADLIAADNPSPEDSSLH